MEEFWRLLDDMFVAIRDKESAKELAAVVAVVMGGYFLFMWLVWLYNNYL